MISQHFEPAHCNILGVMSKGNSMIRVDWRFLSLNWQSLQLPRETEYVVLLSLFESLADSLPLSEPLAENKCTLHPHWIWPTSLISSLPSGKYNHASANYNSLDVKVRELSIELRYLTRKCTKYPLNQEFPLLISHGAMLLTSRLLATQFWMLWPSLILF